MIFFAIVGLFMFSIGVTLMIFNAEPPRPGATWAEAMESSRRTFRRPMVRTGLYLAVIGLILIIPFVLMVALR